MTPGDAAPALADLAVGDSAQLAEPLVPPAQRMRLAELGLRPGQTVRIAQRSVAGARVIAVGGSRIALDAATVALLPIRATSSGERCA